VGARPLREPHDAIMSQFGIVGHGAHVRWGETSTLVFNGAGSPEDGAQWPVDPVGVVRAWVPDLTFPPNARYLLEDIRLLSQDPTVQAVGAHTTVTPEGWQYHWEVYGDEWNSDERYPTEVEALMGALRELTKES